VAAQINSFTGHELVGLQHFLFRHGSLATLPITLPKTIKETTLGLQALSPPTPHSTLHGDAGGSGGPGTDACGGDRWTALTQVTTTTVEARVHLGHFAPMYGEKLKTVSFS
jgi:hypothetical protein